MCGRRMGGVPESLLDDHDCEMPFLLSGSRRISGVIELSYPF
jgi:hypothetical protein